MKRAGENHAGGDNNGAVIPAPRFNEETEATARPVVPLARADASDLHKVPARGRRALIPNPMKSWTQALMITLALGAVVVASIALFSKNETNVSSESPQTINGSAPLTGFERATETLIQTEKSDLSNAPEKTLRAPESRGNLPVRYETSRDDSNEEERLARSEDDDDDREKLAERARKEEKKRLERKWREAEKLAERRRRESEKNSEPKPRLIGIYTERN